MQILAGEGSQSHGSDTWGCVSPVYLDYGHIHITIAVFQIASSILTVLHPEWEITPCSAVRAQVQNNWDLESHCRLL